MRTKDLEASKKEMEFCSVSAVDLGPGKRKDSYLKQQRERMAVLEIGIGEEFIKKRRAGR
jgi:hypothetical protein